MKMVVTVAILPLTNKYRFTPRYNRGIFRGTSWGSRNPRFVV